MVDGQCSDDNKQEQIWEFIRENLSDGPVSGQLSADYFRFHALLIFDERSLEKRDLVAGRRQPIAR